MSAKINTNSNMTFESKMNLKSIPVCSKSIKITAILVTFLRWLQCSWILYNYLSFCVRKSSLDHIKAEVSMKFTFQTCGWRLLFTNKYSILISNIYLQTFRSFQLTCRFHMPFFIIKARIISSQQIEHFWRLETYEVFVAFN